MPQLRLPPSAGAPGRAVRPTRCSGDGPQGFPRSAASAREVGRTNGPGLKEKYTKEVVAGPLTKGVSGYKKHHGARAPRSQKIVVNMGPSARRTANAKDHRGPGADEAWPRHHRDRKPVDAAAARKKVRLPQFQSAQRDKPVGHDGDAAPGEADVGNFLDRPGGASAPARPAWRRTSKVVLTPKGFRTGRGPNYNASGLKRPADVSRKSTT